MYVQGSTTLSREHFTIPLTNHNQFAAMPRALPLLSLLLALVAGTRGTYVVCDMGHAAGLLRALTGTHAPDTSLCSLPRRIPGAAPATRRSTRS